jgi:hypothetical protein
LEIEASFDQYIYRARIYFAQSCCFWNYYYVALVAASLMLVKSKFHILKAKSQKAKKAEKNLTPLGLDPHHLAA